ncbi:MAG: hypothetical protein Fur0010_13120 [Bdellovibrio sp.]
MTNILLVNFRKNGDIFHSFKFAGNIERTVSNSKLSTLAFREFEKSFHILKCSGDKFFIDRKKIQTFFKNRLYSDSLAINQFTSDLEKCLDTGWDIVINSSNDEVGVHMTSLLKQLNPNAKIIGLSLTRNSQIDFGDNWSRVLNEVTTSVIPTPVGYLDCFNAMLNQKHSSVIDSISTVAENNQTAFKNFQQLRGNIGNTFKNLIGIQLLSSSLEKNIPEDVIINIIAEMIDNTNSFPVLLIAPLKNEQELAEKINSRFDGTLTIVECDFIAAPSVLMNLDAVITPDTSIKHLCDLVDVPVVEYAGVQSPPFKMWSTNSNSIIVRNHRSTETTDHDELTQILLQALSYVTGDLSARDISISSSISIYLPIRDRIGIFYKTISGPNTQEEDCTRTIGRYYLGQRLLGQPDNRLFKELYECVGRPAFNKWASTQKESMTENMRLLLSCIRNIGKSKENPKNMKALIESIDAFIATSESSSISAIPALMFRSHFENCPDGVNPLNNAEWALFEAKKDFQVLFEAISRCDQYFLQSAPHYANINKVVGNERT